MLWLIRRISEGLVERHNSNIVAEVLGKDSEDGPVILREEDLIEYMKCDNEYIIPQYHLNRSKPIYVGMNGNYYFLWISNTIEGEKIPAEIKEYNFATLESPGTIDVSKKLHL